MAKTRIALSVVAALLVGVLALGAALAGGDGPDGEHAVSDAARTDAVSATRTEPIRADGWMARVSTLPDAAPDSAEPSGPNATIGFHGHWVIEVRDLNGAMVSRREFDNALLPGAAFNIAEMLLGLSTPGAWTIYVGGACSVEALSVDGCMITNDPTAEIDGDPGTQATLTVSATAGGIVLSGSAIAENAADVTQVVTGLGSCPQSVAPSQCSGIDVAGGNVTLANIAPISVLPGQQVLVTVTLSITG